MTRIAREGSRWRLETATGTVTAGAVVLATLAVSVVLMYGVKATGTLRVSREGELEGLDLHEHGMIAYPEYVIHGYDPGPHAVSGAAK